VAIIILEDAQIHYIRLKEILMQALKVGLISILIVSAAGCQTTGKKIGSGTLYLNSGAQQQFEEYKVWAAENERKDGGTSAFAISPSKWATGTFHAFGGNNPYSRALQGAVDQCGEADCAVYAVNQKVVWQNLPMKNFEGQATIGRGPVTLSTDGEAAYQRYLQNRPAAQNSVVVTNSSGTSGGVAWNKDLEVAKLDAMKSCVSSAFSKGHVPDCAIYDINGEIVWDTSAKVEESDSVRLSVKERLEQLQELLDQGLISESDAEAKRTSILESL